VPQGEVHLGVAEQGQPAQVHVTQSRGDLDALAKTLVRLVPPLAIGAQDPEAVEHHGRATLIAAAGEGIERVHVVLLGVVQFPLNVGNDPGFWRMRPRSVVTGDCSARGAVSNARNQQN
jgi:hypothetical protein